MAELKQSDITSVTAQKLKQIYLERIDLLRRQNDNTLDERRTAEQRGRIKECKRLLRALGHQDVIDRSFWMSLPEPSTYYGDVIMTVQECRSRFQSAIDYLAITIH
jgi:hypothetical protein